MSLKHAVLGLLFDKPRYGYEIKQLFEQTLGDLWRISYGQLYPTFKKLMQDGLVTKQILTGKKALDKNVYSITETGKESFILWMGDNLKHSHFSIKDEVTLFTFFADKLDKKTFSEVLRKHYKTEEGRLRKYTQMHSQLGSDIPSHQKAIVRKMILHLQAELQWLDELLELSLDPEFFAASTGI